MRRNIVTSMGALALLICMGGTASAQFNPSGWIQTDGWNMLFPLVQGGWCAGNGPENMARNWIAPHVIGIEDPKASLTYFNATPGKANTRIDFQGTAASLGWGGLALGPDPSWISNSYVEGVFAGTTMPNGDVVDFQALCDYMNGQPAIVPPGTGTPGFASDGVLGIATTYVQNTTGAPLEVEICTASDDSIQAWVNDQLITNVSSCRGTAGDCAELRVAVLPTGISKISTLTFEGNGGWGFRLAIRVAGVKATDAAGLGITFLGPGVAATVGQATYNIARTSTQEFRCATKDPVQVTLTGAGPGAATDVIVVEESILGVAADIAITGVSNMGVVSDILPPLPPAPTPVGLHFADRTVFGGPCGGANTTTYDVPGAEYTSVGNTGQDIWDGGDGFEFAYTRVSGDFDVSIKFTSRASTGVPASRWGKFGIMAREKRAVCSRYTMIQDHLVDLQDARRLAGRVDYGTCGNMYEDDGFGAPAVTNHPTYFRLTRRGNLFEGWASDDVTVETTPTVDALWSHNNRVDDWGASAPASVYLGFANSEHGSEGCAVQTVKFKVLNATVTPVPLNDPPVPIGKLITWNVTRGNVTSGLSYMVNYNRTGSLQLAGNANLAGVAHASEGAATTLVYALNATGPIGDFDNAHDIGGRSGTGSTTYTVATDSYKMVGAGDDIWAGGDQFQYAYKVVTGDFDMQMHITSRTMPVGGRWGKHGLMARWDCDFNSRYSMSQTNLATSPDVVDTPRLARRVISHDTGNTQEDYVVDLVNQGAALALPATWTRSGNTATVTLVAHGFTAGKPIEVRSSSDGAAIYNEGYFVATVVDADNFTITTLNGGAAAGTLQIGFPVFLKEGRFPTWHRMIRMGNALFFYLSESDAMGNPVKWCNLGSDNDPSMPDTILAGVALTSHAGGNTGEITFDKFSCTPLTRPTEVCTTTAVVISNNLDGAPDNTPVPAPFITITGGATAPAVPFAPVLMANGRLRLTQEGTGGCPFTPPAVQALGCSANAVWLPTDGLFVALGGFVVEFDAFVTHSVPANVWDTNPADGMTFAVVQGNAAYAAANLRGDNGSSLGFQGNRLRSRNECHQSFAVEADLWTGGGNPQTDPEGTGAPNFDLKYHVGIDANGNVSSIQTNVEFGVKTLPDIFHANGVHFEIRYSPAGNVDVYLSGMNGATVVPRTHVLSAQVPPITGPDLLLGWTAGTGGATSTMEIDNPSLSTICCEGANETIAVNGATDALINTNVDLTTTVTGEDAGGTPTYSWTIVSGTGSFVGGTTGSSAQVTSAVAGDVTVKVTYHDGLCTATALTAPVSDEHTISFALPGGTQKPSDFNQDGLFNLSDPIGTLNHLFVGGASALPPCGDNNVTHAANKVLLDSNGDTFVNLSDPIYDLNFLFVGGTNPKPVSCTDNTCPCIVIPDCPNNLIGDCAP